ncbi:hypothetical protein D3C83_105260 [compost metagenome]
MSATNGLAGKSITFSGRVPTSQRHAAETRIGSRRRKPRWAPPQVSSSRIGVTLRSRADSIARLPLNCEPYPVRG